MASGQVVTCLKITQPCGYVQKNRNCRHTNTCQCDLLLSKLHNKCVTEASTYLQVSSVPYPVTSLQDIESPSYFTYENSVRTSTTQRCIPCQPFKNVGTQTIYRESDTQTTPWESAYKVYPDHSPEVLMFTDILWKNGLSFDVHDIEIVKRIIMKKEWANVLAMLDKKDHKTRTSIITALEINEWVYRESEIQRMLDMKLKLIMDRINLREREQNKKAEDRFENLVTRLGDIRDKEISDIRHNFKRDLRKLYKKRDKQQPNSRDIFAQYSNPASELYAPKMQFGEHPQRRHEVLRKRLLKETFIDNAEKYDVTLRWLSTFDQMKIKSKPKPSELCVRFTKWTEKTLEQLHSFLKTSTSNDQDVRTTTLVKIKRKEYLLPTTPVNVKEHADDHLIEAYVLIQKLIKGRAIQYMMCEGRDRCRKLIEELQSTNALEEHGKRIRQAEYLRATALQREHKTQEREEERISQMLSSLEGITVSGMLDFLSKELVRLQDERRAHALMLLAERKRAEKEAVEAGLRQLERNRRREFDEMFRQITKVNQDSIECYLEDIIKEEVEWMSDQEAKKYIMSLIDTIHETSVVTVENAPELLQEELIADMVYNFLLPEVQKIKVRQTIKEKQKIALQNAHAEIFKQMLSVSENPKKKE